MAQWWGGGSVCGGGGTVKGAPPMRSTVPTSEVIVSKFFLLSISKGGNWKDFSLLSISKVGSQKVGKYASRGSV